jgi:ribosomal 50S subunit-recycling heat shock protein
MRLDLFLKQTGLVKRRPIAKAMCDANKILRNGRASKAGDEVRAGDKLRIHYGVRTVDVEILAVPGGNIGKAQREEFFRITGEQREEDEW